MKKKILFPGIIAGIAVCSISNFAFDLQISRIADITLNNSEAIASAREIVFQKDMVQYATSDCTIHFGDDYIPGTYMFCHEMPKSWCAEGCSSN